MTTAKENTILIVDDDPELLTLLKASLSKDFNVQTIRSGAEILSQAENIDAQLILLDVNMPNIDGFEILRKFKQNPKIADTPIVSYSADGSEAVRDRVFALGAAGFMQKPLNVLTLPNDLKAILASANIFLSSFDKKRNFTVAFNQQEQHKLLMRELQQQLDQNKKVLLLTFSEGNHYFKIEFDKAIRSGQLVLLQIKPATVMRFPFLNDLTPLQVEIDEFLPHHRNEYSLFIENPERLLNMAEKQSAVGRVYILRDTLQTWFKRIYCYSAKLTTTTENNLLADIATTFCK